MYYYCEILPDMLNYNNYNSPDDLLKKAYIIFKRDLYNQKIKLNSKPILFFENPVKNGFEQGFYHCTSNSSNQSPQRTIDIYRTQRINWIKPIIENFPCSHNCCDGPLTWIDSAKNYLHIYHHEERFLIVLNERDFVYDFITAFFVEKESQHRKLLKKSKNFT